MFFFILLVFCLGAFVGWKFIPQDFPPQKFQRVDKKVYITYMYRDYVADLYGDGRIHYTSDVVSIDPGHAPNIFRKAKIKDMWK